MKVKMQQMSMCTRWKCPVCGVHRDLNYNPIPPPDCPSGCESVFDVELEELYSPGEKPPEKDQPFQNCFEDCPIRKGKSPDWDKIVTLARRMNGLLDEIEEEIEERR